MFQLETVMVRWQIYHQNFLLVVVALCLSHHLPGMPQSHSSPKIPDTHPSSVKPISLLLSEGGSVPAVSTADSQSYSDNSPQAISVDTPSIQTNSSDSHSKMTPQCISADTPSAFTPSSLTGELSSQNSNTSTYMTTSNFRVCVVNCNSARNKKAVFTNFLNYAKPDIALITETKIDDSISYTEFLPEGYHGKGKFSQLLNWMRQRGFSAWGLQTLPLAACYADFVPKPFHLFVQSLIINHFFSLGRVAGASDRRAGRK